MGKAQIAAEFEQELEILEGRYDRWRESLNDIINDFADEQDINPNALALLLVDLGVTSYMLGYLFNTANPSGAGLKLQLDRFHREIGDFIRSTKKVANEFVTEAKEHLSEFEETDAPGKPNAA